MPKLTAQVDEADKNLSLCEWGKEQWEKYAGKTLIIALQHGTGDPDEPQKEMILGYLDSGVEFSQEMEDELAQEYPQTVFEVFELPEKGSLELSDQR